MSAAPAVGRRASVKVGGAEVSYIDAGDGPVALFIHGVFLNSWLWRHVIEALAGHGERRCIAIDLPAHGQTKVPADQDLSLPALADLIDQFCDALKAEGVPTAVHYPRPLTRQPAFAAWAKEHPPVAERLAQQVFALPIHHDLSDAQVEQVGEALRKVAGAFRA